MGYHHLEPAAIEATPGHSCERHSISDAAGLSNLATALYVVQPGEQLAQSYHYHEQREECFYVLAGTLSVRTPSETYRVGPDEVFVVEPESPILPHVPDGAGEAARVLGVGAPSYDPGRPYEPDGDE